MLPRRKILFRLGVGVIALLLIINIIPFLFQLRRASVLRDQTVVVVGAGISGISAAKTLMDAGIEDIIILEGANRIGGRIYTSEWESDGKHTDLGANWIHNINGNPLFNLCLENGIPIEMFNYDFLVAYKNDGTLMQCKAFEDSYKEFKRVENEFLKKRPNTEFDTPFEEELLKQGTNLTKEEFWFHLANEVELEYGTVGMELSSWFYDNDSRFKGQDAVIPGGYKQLLEFLAKGIDIRLKKKVVEMTLNRKSSDGQALVVTEDGERHDADFVILTAPLGVLKAQSIKFQPKLPPFVMNSINGLRFGDQANVALRFKTAFWRKGSKRLVTDFTPQNSCQGYPFMHANLIGYISKERSLWPLFVNQYEYYGIPVLMAHVGEPFVRKVEAMTDHQVVESVMETLKLIFGDDAEYPVEMKRTRFKTNPLFNGALTSIPFGGDGDLHHGLLGVVHDSLIFAGEATSEQYVGTVHGAYLSGIRAAKQLLREI